MPVGTSDIFATEHTEIVISPDALKIVPQLVTHYGDPFGDSSAIPSFYVAQAASRDVTVVLNGDGGDESFAGYNRYLSNAMAERTEAFPLSMRTSVARAAGALPESPVPNSTWGRIRRLCLSLPIDRHARYLARDVCICRRASPKLYTQSSRRRLDPVLLSSGFRMWRGHLRQTRLLTECSTST